MAWLKNLEDKNDSPRHGLTWAFVPFSPFRFLIYSLFLFNDAFVYWLVIKLDDLRHPNSSLKQKPSLGKERAFIKRSLILLCLVLAMVVTWNYWMAMLVVCLVFLKSNIKTEIRHNRKSQTKYFCWRKVFIWFGKLLFHFNFIVIDPWREEK